ncbi:phosphatase PAP2 family protein [Carboxylicivirga sediminis]|uniref:Phosphatase PAP2 family protein n=1 Tax=Carboxylicivirga sediminis TaxID=2006564 RepID=A0A941IZV8_9BACT|nr:phosphatase PAP2 family protein [Carboxylicivirga sediminis]MBR8537733.1 phosphatase PAP2 family protein [Carboxylicivirga sediminis]
MILRIRLLLLISFICLLILSSTFFLPYGFSVIHEGWLATFWLLISNTGGTIGVPLITILFCILISMHYKGWKSKLLVITGALVVFSLVLGVFARVNEYFIKEQLKVERPNIIFLHESMGFDSEAFYNIESKDERRAFIEDFFNGQLSQVIMFDDEPLHPKVITHWLHETGYSFPSGHSVNAFLMATLMAYIILFIYSDFRRRLFFILPFAWATLVALSRVLLGVHTALDISLGAAIGCLVAFLIISTRLIDRHLMPKSVDA